MLAWRGFHLRRSVCLKSQIKLQPFTGETFLEFSVHGSCSCRIMSQKCLHAFRHYNINLLGSIINDFINNVYSSTLMQQAARLPYTVVKRLLAVSQP